MIIAQSTVAIERIGQVLLDLFPLTLVEASAHEVKLWHEFFGEFSEEAIVKGIEDSKRLHGGRIAELAKVRGCVVAHIAANPVRYAVADRSAAARREWARQAVARDAELAAARAWLASLGAEEYARCRQAGLERLPAVIREREEMTPRAGPSPTLLASMLLAAGKTSEG